jgi:hypothetical protein
MFFDKIFSDYTSAIRTYYEKSSHTVYIKKLIHQLTLFKKQMFPFVPRHAEQ